MGKGLVTMLQEQAEMQVFLQQVQELTVIPMFLILYCGPIIT